MPIATYCSKTRRFIHAGIVIALLWTGGCVTNTHQTTDVAYSGPRVCGYCGLTTAGGCICFSGNHGHFATQWRPWSGYAVPTPGCGDVEVLVDSTHEEPLDPQPVDPQPVDPPLSLPLPDSPPPVEPQDPPKVDKPVVVPRRVAPEPPPAKTPAETPAEKPTEKPTGKDAPSDDTNDTPPVSEPAAEKNTKQENHSEPPTQPANPAIREPEDAKTGYSQPAIRLREIDLSSRSEITPAFHIRPASGNASKRPGKTWHPRSTPPDVAVRTVGHLQAQQDVPRAGELPVDESFRLEEE